MIKCRIPLELSSSVKVPVVFVLTKLESLPSLRKCLKAYPAQRGKGVGAPEYVALTPERFFYRADDAERRPVAVPGKGGGAAASRPGGGDISARAEGEAVAFAYPLGKELVAISSFEQEEHLAVLSEKRLALMGVLPLEELKWW